MNQNRNPILSFLSSLRLTVTLLALAMVLIFAGTTVQAEKGIWDVQRIYFHSWICLIEWRLLFPLWEWGNKTIPGAIPFPGGYTLIALLLVNLLTAHSQRFKFHWLDFLIIPEVALIFLVAIPTYQTWFGVMFFAMLVASVPLVLHCLLLHRKRGGVILIHLGLILLLGGEVVTAELAAETRMTIPVGQSANWTHDIREVELAVTDPSPADHDQEIIIPPGRLLEAGTIQHPKLPFTIRIDSFEQNSTVMGPREPDAPPNSRRATTGTGVGIALVPLKQFTGTDGGKIDHPAGFFTFLGSSGQSLGTYLLSTLQLSSRFLQIDQPQIVNVDGKEYWVQLRFRREYKPYRFELLKFSHDKYTGTNVPRNFSSLVRVFNSNNDVDREVLIWMNHPLRYAGETFYQSGFDEENDQFTILQVVHNPGWLIPYVSCTVVGLGMLVHFGMHLLNFLSRLNVKVAPQTVTGPKRRLGSTEVIPAPSWIPAAVISGLCVIYILAVMRSTDRPPSDYDLNAFASLPISYDGRTMPLDSLARNSLRILSGKSDLRTDEGKLPAIEWLLDIFAQPKVATQARVFRIDHPDILSLMGLDEKQKLFSPQDLNAKLPDLQKQFDMARFVDSKKRDMYQRKIVDLGQRIMLFERLVDAKMLLLSPPLQTKDWRPLGQALSELDTTRDPGAESFVEMVDARHERQPARFNAIAAGYRAELEKQLPQIARKLDLEVIFNRAAPFYHCMVIYVIVFLLAAMSWLKWHGPLARASLWVLVVAFLFHTLGLVTRIYLQGRPPVTNLYSSAVFIAWGAVLFCVVMEMIYRNGVASAAAASIAFPSLLIAHFLAGDGDTMKMLQAVLDTNIWLATHVVVITLGYTATFLAGILGIAYVVRVVMSGGNDQSESGRLDLRTAAHLAHNPAAALTHQTNPKTIARMIYGVVCFAMLLSFVGTILGGIWADQSWGRFWGWDPKENGAVLIVLWNAIILHARWGGLVREFGMAQLAIFGNAVTAWSWFGTNMLGVGLHSYGFMDSAVFWLASWVGLQLAIITFGVVWKLRGMEQAPLTQSTNDQIPMTNQ